MSHIINMSDPLDELEREFTALQKSVMGDDVIQIPDDTPAEPVWTQAGETVLAQCSEKAAAFRWMHHQCSVRYKVLDAKFQLPIIVVSSLTGGVSLSLGSVVPDTHQTLAQTIVGTLNLLVGIVSSVAQFIKAASLAEGHRAASIAWGRLARRLQIELALEPHLRSEDQESLIKSTLSTYDNLCEQGPVIDVKIIEEFRTTFGVDPPEPSISRPEIVGGPVKVHIFGRNPISTPPARRSSGMWSKGLRAIGLKRPKTPTEDVVT